MQTFTQLYNSIISDGRKMQEDGRSIEEIGQCQGMCEVLSSRQSNERKKKDMDGMGK